jgi:CAAX protease family protein
MDSAMKDRPIGRVVWTLWVLGFVGAAYLAFRLIPGPWDGVDWAEGVFKMALWVAPVALALRAAGLATYRAVRDELGLGRRAVVGYGFGLLATLPMLAMLPLGWTLRGSLSSLIGSVVLGPFAEEVLFRGFLFRQLVRRAGWNVVAALVVSALAFGLAHVANVDLAGPNGLRDAALEVTATAGGGLLFAWVFLRWGSLWPAIGLHTFMNLSWQLFGVDNWAARAHLGATALGPSAPNLARAASVALAAGLTIWQYRRARVVRAAA